MTANEVIRRRLLEDQQVAARYVEPLEVRASEYGEDDSYSLYVCDECGAVVRHRYVHNAWHLRLDGQP